MVTLLLTPALIGENGGEGRVTATASPASAEAFTVTVSAVAVDPAVAGDFTLAGATLSFAADATMSTGEVTITAVDNDVDAPDKMVTASPASAEAFTVTFRRSRLIRRWRGLGAGDRGDDGAGKMVMSR